MNPPNDAASAPEGGSAQPKQHSLLRASALMASGTLVSRILGLVRSMMLLAVIGSAGGGVAAAFQTANTLPNTVFNILASGVFDAVLVPQIVGALKRKYDGETYINRLLTLAGVILFGITVVSMIAAPLLVIITAAGYDAEIRALAILFALLCLPQLFFYGLYNLLGELLNARRVFGPYMWAPVVNNVIGIAGLTAFFLLWGTTDGRIEIADFTSAQFWVLGGSATLGVIAQALILLIPMRRAGIRFRPDFRFRGTSFRSASKVAGWTFATLMVSQIGILSTNNLASLADSYAKTHNVFDVVGINAYATAFMIFMVPQSLISVSLATAIFTHMAEYAAEHDDAAIAKSYQMGVRTITFLVLLAAAILMAGSVPMMQIVLPTQRNSAVVVAYAIILVALMPGVASTGMGLMSLRFFYAYEDVKPVFLFGIVPALIQVVIGWSIYAVSDPHWWVAGAAFAETFALIIHALIALFGVARRNPLVDRKHLLVSYAVFFFCAALAGAAAFGALSLVGVNTSADSTLLRFLVATGKMVLVAAVATPVYLLALRLLSPGLSALAAAPLLARLRVPAPLRRVFAAPIAGNGETADIMGEETDSDSGGPMDEDEKFENDESSSPDPVPDADAAVPTDEEAVPSDSEEGLPAPAEADDDAAPSEHEGEDEGAHGLGDVFRSSDGTDSETNQDEAPLPSFEEILTSQEGEAEEPGESAHDSAPSHSEENAIAGRTCAWLTAVSAAAVASAEKVKAHFAAARSVAGAEEADGASAAEGDAPDLTAGIAVGDEGAAACASDGESPVVGESSGSRIPAPVAGAAIPMAAAGASGFDAVLAPSPAVLAPSTAGAPTSRASAEEILTMPDSDRGARSPESPAPGRTDRERRLIDPTKPTLILAAALTVAAAVWAVSTALSPVTDLDIAQSIVDAQSGGAQSAQSALGDDAATAAPLISSVSVLSWNNDDGDHPDLAVNMIDQNPETSWRSRYFDINAFDENATVTIVVNLEGPALVSGVTLQMDPSTQGGEVVVRNVTDPSNPRGGTELATSALSESTVISLPEPTEASAIALSFRVMPTSVDGRPWAWVSELSVQ
ncbi:lipid II flippase MurJ [Schaalia sp.]|uniref:lipid II flippase MurJ n=1 Tax=Schaalia sp. TaxID=2691890 RepID=UPI003D10D393